MTNEGLSNLFEDIAARRAPIKAATTRLTNIIDADCYLTDDRGMIVCSNDTLDEAQQFIRNNLDLNGQGLEDIIACNWNHLSNELAQSILDDLRILWDDEFSRDLLSQWAMGMSLCPMHFIDWAACFDDDDPDCSQIRAIFPNSHDT